MWVLEANCEGTVCRHSLFPERFEQPFRPIWWRVKNRVGGDSRSVAPVAPACSTACNTPTRKSLPGSVALRTISALSALHTAGFFADPPIRILIICVHRVDAFTNLVPVRG